MLKPEVLGKEWVKTDKLSNIFSWMVAIVCQNEKNEFILGKIRGHPYIT